jgi:hypothetical protein
LGDYLLRITLVATRVAGKTTTMKKCTTFAGHLMAVAVRRYNTARIAQWRRFMVFLEATECHHWASICSDNIKLTYQVQFF